MIFLVAVVVVAVVLVVIVVDRRVALTKEEFFAGDGRRVESPLPPNPVVGALPIAWPGSARFLEFTTPSTLEDIPSLPRGETGL